MFILYWEKIKKIWPLIILIFLSFSVHFFFLSQPSEVVFDEVHFGKFVSAYFTHNYYFDIHPPLGKLMIAGFAKIFGYQGNFDFSVIGTALSAKNLFILRFLPALLGALFPVLIYKFILALGLSKRAAFCGGFLMLFDGAFLVQSKFILVDVFSIFFGFASLYFFFLAKNLPKRQNLLCVVSAIFSALSLSVKWVGVSFLGMIFFFIFLDFLKTRNLKDFSKKIAIFAIIPLASYFLIFAVHFNLLKNSGPGDAFMSPSFQKTLLGNKVGANIAPVSLLGKFIELNKAMYIYNAGIKGSHPDGSRWYEWPLMKRPIWYWAKNLNAKMANIYFLGNPIVWISAALSVLWGIFALFFARPRKELSPWIYFLLLGYFINLLPFALVGRVTFLYHYLPSLAFGILVFVLLCDKFIFPKITPKLYFPAFLFLIFALFLIFSPLTYGFPVAAGFNQWYNIFIGIFH